MNAASYCPKRGRKGVHCAHFTGRGMTNGLAKEGTSEVVCCFCGTTANIGWTRLQVTPRGHGAHAAFADNVHDWPSHWRAADAREGTT